MQFAWFCLFFRIIWTATTLEWFGMFMSNHNELFNCAFSSGKWHTYIFFSFYCSAKHPFYYFLVQLHISWNMYDNWNTIHLKHTNLRRSYNHDNWNKCYTEDIEQTLRAFNNVQKLILHSKVLKANKNEMCPKCTCTYKHHQTTIQQKQSKTFEVSWLATGTHKLCWAYHFFRSHPHLCLVQTIM